MELIDVEHLGRERVIGCWRVEDVLIDPGPESSLGMVYASLGDDVPAAVLLTHIHLDHAGGTGALVRRWPHLRVLVQERGARHLADPSRLVASAGRLYGEQMDRLWGEIVPVPPENIEALAGGERVRGFEVAYTPGHASHHVSYLHVDTGWAFVGDTAAVRIAPGGFVLPPTPPPDIDLRAWNGSLDTIESWSPDALALTHFGEVDDPPAHLDAVRRRLSEQGKRAKDLDADGFEEALRRDVAEASDPQTAAALLQAVPPEQQYLGLERYWRKAKAR